MKLYRVDQQLISNPLKDIPAEVRRTLDASNIQVPKGEVAVTVGSRGIANIATIARAVGDWLRDKGARPFIVPAMGSHNGATADGQLSMLHTLGITEAATGMPIRASMDVVQIGSVSSGPVFMDRHCYESAGVMVLNRIKLHTGFSGPVQSGLVKMMVVGMGKIRSAETFHSTPSAQMSNLLIEMAKHVLDSRKILGGLAILEDGFDQTAELHAMPANSILTREPELLERHRAYFPTLPLDAINVLIVDTIGKCYSGTGMDTNVIGFRGVRDAEDIARPRIQTIAALRLHADSQGNAIGVGLADFITRELRDAIDEEKTLVNVLTTGEMARIKIPATLDNDLTLVTTISRRFGAQGWVWIPNTLHLHTLYVSEDLCEPLSADPCCTVATTPTMLGFQDGRHNLTF